MNRGAVATFKVVLATLLVLFFACTSAQMMEHRGASQYAPLNEQPGGRIRYLAEGLPGVINARREDAYRQMYDRCGGRYRITQEFVENGATFTTVTTQRTTTASVQANGNAQYQAFRSPYATTGYGYNQWNASGSATTVGQANVTTDTQKFYNIIFACVP